MWRLILLALLATLTPQQRNLSYPVEPLPLPLPLPIVVGDIYLPMIHGVTGVTAENATVYGYASPHKRRYNVPYYNWSQRPDDCINPNYWPMARGQMDYEISICDNGDRMLLLYNEPELGSFSATPRQATAFVNSWSWWSGPSACCGNFYGDGGGDLTGIQWFLTFVTEYHIAHGIVPPIDYIHLHVYEQDGLDLDTLAMWRDVADAYGWGIIISESGTMPRPDYPPEVIAERLPGFLALIERELQPEYLFWFSDYLFPWALGGPPQAAWHRLNLTDVNGNLTPVGAAWETYTGRRIDEDRAK